MAVIGLTTLAVSLSIVGSAANPAAVNRVLAGDLLALKDAVASVDAKAASAGYFWMGVLVILTASTVVGIRCSGAITGEREKHTWEALLLTPLTTRQLVRAKLWGVIGTTYPYLAMFAAPALLVALAAEQIGAVTITLIVLGVTWMAMFYVGAAGLWCSARAKSSWRSLLALFGWAYLGGFLLYAVLSPLLLVVYLLISLFLVIVEEMVLKQTSRSLGLAFGFDAFMVAVAIVLVGMFLLGSWLFLREAEKRVADYERTRHWRDEPPPLLRRRRLRRARKRAD
jgi:ABC-type transport system involved in multi-copper enzyme maturation permease subunit